MSQIVRRMACAPEDVFEVLADGWLYPVWVVGAARMREVDVGWPNVGTRLHHSVGAWPLLLDDETVSREWDPPHRMVLTARGWPVGEARVVIEARPDGDGCLVRIREDASAGPARLIPRPLRLLALEPRNREALRRLAYLAEGVLSRRTAAEAAEAEVVAEAREVGDSDLAQAEVDAAEAP